MKYIKYIFLLVLLQPWPLLSAVPREGLSLYDRALYDRARVVFDSSDDPLSGAWSVLCAVRGRVPGYESLIAEYESSNPKSILYDEIHYRYGLDLFSRSNYRLAGEQFALVSEARLDADELSEYRFDRAYCVYDSGKLKEAAERFEAVRGMGRGRFFAPASYYLGVMAYDRQDFAVSEKLFAESRKDRRFKELSDFYILECRFMAKDYEYVTANAERQMKKAPAERKARLSRMLSESYLIKGDKAKARKFYEQEKIESSSPKTRSDWFHAGSVLFATGEYEAAIEAFNSMESRCDSIGQIANYQLGYSYVKRGNKVAALEAFNEAAKYSFDSDIKEDAAFNYAKLAFDINHDSNGLKAYISVFSTAKKGEQIYDYMALASLVNKDYATAIDNYDKIEELTPVQKSNFVKANYLRGRQLSDAGSWSDAVPYLKASLFHFPKNDRFNQLARYSLAEALYHQGNYAQAQGYFTELYNAAALRATVQGGLLAYNIAYCNYETSNFEAAARWFDKYFSDGGKQFISDARERRADCDFYRADYKSAAERYAVLNATEKMLPSLYTVYREGQCYGFLKENEKKIKTLSVVADFNSSTPYYAETLYELGRSYLDGSHYDQADKTFELLRKNAPDSSYVAKALVGQGMTRRNAKRYDAALDSYKELVALMPGSEYARESLRAIEAIYQAKKQPGKYLEWLEKAKPESLEMTPEKKRGLTFSTAEKLYLQGSYPEASKMFLDYISAWPSDSKIPDAWFYLADSYRLMDEKEKSCDAFSKALELLPEDSGFTESALLSCASLNVALERYKVASDYYGRAIKVCKLESNKKAAREGLLKSAYKARDYETAIEASSEVDGDFSDFIRAKSLLATSRRTEAFALFRKLSTNPSTPEGAESELFLIQDCLDRADYEDLEKRVYEFSSKAGSQSYFLAKSYLLLGDSFLMRGNTAQAKATWESIRDGYTGNDDIAENVQMRLQRMESDLKK